MNSFDFEIFLLDNFCHSPNRFIYDRMNIKKLLLISIQRGHNF